MPVHDLDVVLVLPGSIEIERGIHHQLAQRNTQREWFCFSSPMEARVKVVSSLLCLSDLAISELDAPGQMRLFESALTAELEADG